MFSFIAPRWFSHIDTKSYCDVKIITTNYFMHKLMAFSDVFKVSSQVHSFHRISLFPANQTPVMGVMISILK